jgi:hypothetical protein
LEAPLFYWNRQTVIVPRQSRGLPKEIKPELPPNKQFTNKYQMYSISENNAAAPHHNNGNNYEAPNFCLLLDKCSQIPCQVICLAAQKGITGCIA